MEPLPILDLYVLSMLDRGLTSLYDLQRQAGLSLGASTPAIKRLTRLGLVTRSADRSKGNRKKYQLGLDQTGKQAARNAWRKLIDSPPPADLDAILRIVDMALHYGGKNSEIAEFVSNAATTRVIRSQRSAFLAANTLATAISRYPQLRSECDLATMNAEAELLQKIAKRLKGLPKRRRERKSVTYVQEILDISKS